MKSKSLVVDECMRSYEQSTAAPDVDGGYMALPFSFLILLVLLFLVAHSHKQGRGCATYGDAVRSASSG